MLCAMLALGGCGSNDKVNYDPKNYVDYIVSGQEYTTLNYLNSYSSADLRVTANLVDGLMETDIYGRLVGSLADKWEHNEDYTVWTFHIREDAKWYTSEHEEYAKVTADDFVYAAEFILDPINASGNANSYLGVIEGATEYYEKKTNGEEVDFSMVGVKALDERTIQYTMAGHKGVPYFDSAACYCAFYPANRKYVESLDKTDQGTSKFGIDKDHILYNGAFILDECTLEQEKLFSKNEGYWDKDQVTFDTVKVMFFKDQESVYQAFLRGEVSYTPLMSDQAKKLYDEKNENLVQKDLTSWNKVIFLNNKTEYSDQTNQALSNLNFRKSLFYGIDRTLYNEVSNPINPSSIEGFSYTATDFVYTSDGTDYTQLGHLKQWQTSQFDLSKAKTYKEKAMEELSSQGVSFPVKLIYQSKAGNETEANRARMLKEAIEALGTDYVEVELQEYQTWADVRNSGQYALQISGWGPDWADPVNLMISVKSNSGTMNSYDNHLTYGISHWNYPEFDAMVETADKITDKDARYEAFANVESWLLENAYYIPMYQEGGTYELTTINNYTKMHTDVGLDQFKWKGIVAYDHVISTKENEQFKIEWQTARKEILGQE